MTRLSPYTVDLRTSSLICMPTSLWSLINTTPHNHVLDPACLESCLCLDRLGFPGRIPSHFRTNTKLSSNFPSFTIQASLLLASFFFSRSNRIPSRKREHSIIFLVGRHAKTIMHFVIKYQIWHTCRQLYNQKLRIFNSYHH